LQAAPSVCRRYPNAVSAYDETAACAAFGWVPRPRSRLARGGIPPLGHIHIGSVGKSSVGVGRREPMLQMAAGRILSETAFLHGCRRRKLSRTRQPPREGVCFRYKRCRSAGEMSSVDRVQYLRCRKRQIHHPFGP
jgi:hypothetical protein